MTFDIYIYDDLQTKKSSKSRFGAELCGEHNRFWRGSEAKKFFKNSPHFNETPDRFYTGMFHVLSSLF